MSLPPGTILGRYRILRRLGAGAMGEVYLAEDPQIERQLALKTVRLLSRETGDTEELEARLLREAKAAGRLVHSHVVTLFDAGEAEGLFFLAFEYVDGPDLSRRMKAPPPLTLGEILRIGREAAEGLEAAHRREIVHRDIKPSNLLLDSRNRVKISDFGIAKLVGQRTELTQTGSVIGSPHYLSPEQVRGEDLDGRSDLFSLGVVLYELLTRKRPFEGDTITTLVYQILSRDPTPIGEVAPDLPVEVREIVDRLLEKDREDRFDSAEELARALRRCEEELPSGVLSAPVALSRDVAETRVMERDSSVDEGPMEGSTDPTVVQAPPGPGTPPPPGPPPPPPGAGPEPVPEAPPEEPPPPPPGGTPSAASAASDVSSRADVAPRADRPAGRGWLVASLLALALAGAGVAAWWVFGDRGAPRPPEVRGEESPEVAFTDPSEGGRGAPDEIASPEVDRPGTSGEDADDPEPETSSSMSPAGGPEASPPGTSEPEPEPEPKAAEEGTPPGSEERGVAVGQTEGGAEADESPEAGERESEPRTAVDPEVVESPEPETREVPEDRAPGAETAEELTPEPRRRPADRLEELADRVDREMSTGLGLIFDVEPEDTFVLLRGRNDRRFLTLGQASEWSGGRNGRIYTLPGPGDYLLQFRDAASRTKTVLIHARPGGGPTEISVNMNALSGERVARGSLTRYRVGEGIVLDVDPRRAARRASVLIDGERRGAVRDFSSRGNPLRLSTGDHRVAIVAPGFRRVDFLVEVRPGHDDRLEQVSVEMDRER